MKKLKLGLIGISLVALSITPACDKDDNGSPIGPCSGYSSWALSVQDELNTATTAGIAYANDPTPANCAAYKAAYQDYIDALENVRGCVAGAQTAAYQQAIDSAKASLSSLC